MQTLIGYMLLCFLSSSLLRDLNGLSLEGILAPELGKLSHLRTL